MTSDILVGGVNLDSLLAAWVSGQDTAAATDYEVSSTDIAGRYAMAKYGTAYGTTGYTVSNENYAANTDIGNIFAKAGSLITPLTLYYLYSGPSIYLGTPAGSSTSQTNTVVGTNAADYGTIANKNATLNFTTNNFISSYTGYGAAYTIASALTFAAGTWTISVATNNQTGNFNLQVGLWHYTTSNSTYNLLAHMTTGFQTYSGGNVVNTVSTSQPTIAMAANDQIVIDLQIGFQVSPTGSIGWLYGNNAATTGSVITPGYT